MINNLASWLSLKFCVEPEQNSIKVLMPKLSILTRISLKIFLRKFTFKFHSSVVKVNQIFQNLLGRKILVILSEL